MKTVCIPKITQTNQKNVFKYENTPIAFITYTTLNIDGESKLCEKINEYYARLTQKYANWVTKSFKKYAEHEYLNDNHPRKRFRYKPLCLSYTMLYEVINERYLGVEIQVSLTKNGSPIGNRQLNHLWDLSNGYLQIQKTKKR